jgi:hypothetical protein
MEIVLLARFLKRMNGYAIHTDYKKFGKVGKNKSKLQSVSKDLDPEWDVRSSFLPRYVARFSFRRFSGFLG